MEEQNEALKYFYKGIRYVEDIDRLKAYSVAIKAIEAQCNPGVVRLDLDHWVSKNGVIVEFEDMSNDYLNNVISMLKRSYNNDELKHTATFQGLVSERAVR